MGFVNSRMEIIEKEQDIKYLRIIDVNRRIFREYMYDYREYMYDFKSCEITSIKYEDASSEDVVNIYSNKINNLPYYYDIKYRDKKIVIKSKVINVEIKNDEVRKRLLSTSIVFNLESGRSYMMGIRDEFNKLISRDIINNHLIEITYLNEKQIESLGLNELILIPEFEWKKISCEILKFNGLNEKYKKRNIANLIRLNNFPFGYSKYIDKAIKIIRIKGLKTNTLSYFNRKRGKIKLVKYIPELEMQWVVVYHVILKYLVMLIKDKEIAIKIVDEYVKKGGLKLFIKKEYNKGCYVEKIIIPSYIDIWLKQFIKINGIKNSKEKIKDEVVYLREMLKEYRILRRNGLNIDIESSDSINKILKVYKDSNRMFKMLNII